MSTRTTTDDRSHFPHAALAARRHANRGNADRPGARGLTRQDVPDLGGRVAPRVLGDEVGEAAEVGGGLLLVRRRRRPRGAAGRRGGGQLAGGSGGGLFVRGGGPVGVLSFGGAATVAVFPTAALSPPRAVEGRRRPPAVVPVRVRAGVVVCRPGGRREATAGARRGVVSSRRRRPVGALDQGPIHLEDAIPRGVLVASHCGGTA